MKTPLPPLLVMVFFVAGWFGFSQDQIDSVVRRQIGLPGCVHALLIWVYYSSLIVLFGAELTQVWSNRFGSGTRPTHGAARMVQETHRVQDQPPLDGDSGPI